MNESTTNNFVDNESSDNNVASDCLELSNSMGCSALSHPLSQSIQHYIDYW